MTSAQDATTIKFLPMKTYSILSALLGLLVALVAIITPAYHCLLWPGILGILSLACWVQYKRDKGYDGL